MFSMVTNDLGEFRVSGLMPGSYLFSANPDDGGMISIVSGRDAPGTQAIGDGVGFATTYYPGTLSPDQAESITVDIANIANVSFSSCRPSV